MSRKRDMARAKAKIAATDWFTYISATLVCNIQRSIIPIAAAHVEGGGDWMDACSAIAAWANPMSNGSRLLALTLGNQRAFYRSPLGTSC